MILPVVFDNPQSLALSQSERTALDLLVKASERIGSPVFDLKQMDKNFSDWSKGYKYRKSLRMRAVANSPCWVPLRLAAGERSPRHLRRDLAFLSIVYFGVTAILRWSC